MTRPCADAGKTEFLEQLAKGALVIVDAKALQNDRLEIYPPPSDHTVDGGIGSRLDQVGQLCLLLDCQARVWPSISGILEPIRTALIEPVHPIAQGLAVHAADASSIGAVHPVHNSSQRQQAPTWLTLPQLRDSRRNAAAE